MHTLHSHDIHVWTYKLTHDATTIEKYFSLLSEDEKQRAQRFMFEKDRQRYIASRGWMRTQLAYYLKHPPQEIVFTTNRFGKPQIAPDTNINALNFNLSHSHERAVLAVTLKDAIGIDVEYIREEIEYQAIVQRFFSTQEATAFHALDAHEQLNAFFHTWACKEAVLKALGTGMSLPLNHIEVSVDPKHAAKLLMIGEDKEVAKTWSIYSLKIDTDYAAALAVSGAGHKIIYK